jgi:hypothetical protein
MRYDFTAKIKTLGNAENKTVLIIGRVDATDDKDAVVEACKDLQTGLGVSVYNVVKIDVDPAP